MTADFVLAGTGSRSLRTAPRELQVAAWDACLELVAQRVAEHGPRLVVMSGGAEGWDELLARVAIRLGVRLHLVLPSKSYANHYWGRASVLKRDRMPEFREIASAEWRTTYVAEQILGTTGLYVDGLHINFHRNLIMTEWADDFAVWDPTSRGTAHCVGAIKAAGKWRDNMVLGPAPAPIRHHLGDLLTAGLPAIGHGVNTRGIMGAGIAAQIRHRWPALHADYRKACHTGQLQLGGIHTWQAPDGPLIYGLASQDRPGPHATLPAIRQAVTAMVDDAHRRGITTVGVPRIGAGLGGLPWADVEALLVQVMAGRPVRLVVCSLAAVSERVPA